MAGIRFKTITQEIDKAISYQPKGRIKEICGDYYSPYYRFFWQIGLRLPKDALLVELGVHNGRGLCSLALSGRLCVGVDTHIHPELVNNIGQFDNVTFLNKSSMPVPSWFVGKKISLLHLDTEHSYAQVESELRSYEPYFADQCIVVFDDLHAADDSVLKYFYERPEGNKIQVDAMHPECGWGVLLWNK